MLHVPISLLGLTLHHIIREHQWKSCCNFKSKNSIWNKLTKDCCDSSLGNIMGWDHAMSVDTHSFWLIFHTQPIKNIWLKLYGKVHGDIWLKLCGKVYGDIWLKFFRKINGDFFEKKNPGFPFIHDSLLSHNPTIDWKCHCDLYRERIFERGEKWLWVRCHYSNISFL